jgi:hypothetical protein
MIDEHPDNLEDATDQPVNAQKLDNEKSGFPRGNQQEKPNDQCEDALYKDKPPGYFHTLHLCFIRGHKIFSFLFLDD